VIKPAENVFFDFQDATYFVLDELEQADKLDRFGTRCVVGISTSPQSD